jgi:methyltransferase (TIGR00027 family)
MALFRAQESALPEGKRLFDDPFALSFLTPRHRTVSAMFRVPIVRSLLARWMDARWPGARTSAIARTRLIDEWASAAATAGLQQAVILGAGFDCRAWRLSAFSGVAVFEVDYPATSAKKQKLIREVGASTERVCFAPVDFERESLTEGLAKTVFRADKPTLVIWEGVTNYLTAEAVDATMRWVATLAKGSRMIFTYVDADVVNSSARFDDAGGARRAVARVGEPWTFGFRPKELPTYLKARGLRLVRDMSADEYRAYAMGERAVHAKGYEFYHVALTGVGS